MANADGAEIANTTGALPRRYVDAIVDFPEEVLPLWTEINAGRMVARMSKERA